MFKKIAIVLVVFIALFSAVAAMQPEDFKITRSLSMSAPPYLVFAQVNVFKNWQAWSPWAKLDPNAAVTYEGPEMGVGSIYSWKGNSQVGEGRMTITESRTNDMVQIKLEFLKPFATTNTAEFTFVPDGEKTVVTWSMTGKRSFIEKAFSLVLNMDSMVGADFEKGLSAMQSVAESEKSSH